MKRNETKPTINAKTYCNTAVYVCVELRRYWELNRLETKPTAQQIHFVYKVYSTVQFNHQMDWVKFYVYQTSSYVEYIFFALYLKQLNYDRKISLTNFESCDKCECQSKKNMDKQIAFEWLSHEYVIKSAADNTINRFILFLLYEFQASVHIRMSFVLANFFFIFSLLRRSVVWMGKKREKKKGNSNCACFSVFQLN